MTVSSRVARELSLAVIAAGENEACGFLLGKARSRRRRVTDLVHARSSASTPREFELTDAEIRRLRAWCADRGQQILALFHSHPSGVPTLSSSDRAALRYSEWPWVVVARSTDYGSVTLTGYAAGSGDPFPIVVDSNCRTQEHRWRERHESSDERC